MSKKLFEISEHAQKIMDAALDLPSQYAQKIEELCSTIVSVTAMAEGANIVTINVQDLGEGTHVVDGRTITIENGEIRLGS
jgi:hypothetical protein